MGIAENIYKFRKELPEGVKLVAITKTKPNEDIMEAYQAGHKIFGENKVQELVSKYQDLPKDIEWHMVGHLQSNKVKYIAPFVHLIHGVDRPKLFNVIDKEGKKNNRVLDVLMQFHIAREETKFGFNLQEAKELLDSEAFNNYDFIKVRGLMGMATFTEDMEQVRSEFRELVNIFNKLKENYFPNDPAFKEISMGMSNDYHVALEEGTTMVRIGSLIFGKRNIH
ncbi:MAG: YggS family pyridoxal phosphate-dependent enzyme [Bacteroidales bacterium]|nr:YggS family pyridoxal phosphate-dependent enzyme [Bacteroidales bacterium]MBS3775358.1 YggS family pyridoxal phosphate-dependent enzyme [Bacteroidales bacterium]